MTLQMLKQYFATKTGETIRWAGHVRDVDHAYLVEIVGIDGVVLHASVEPDVRLSGHERHGRGSALGGATVDLSRVTTREEALHALVTGSTARAAAPDDRTPPSPDEDGPDLALPEFPFEDPTGARDEVLSWMERNFRDTKGRSVLADLALSHPSDPDVWLYSAYEEGDPVRRLALLTTAAKLAWASIAPAFFYPPVQLRKTMGGGDTFAQAVDLMTTTLVQLGRHAEAVDVARVNEIYNRERPSGMIEHAVAAVMAGNVQAVREALDRLLRARGDDPAWGEDGWATALARYALGETADGEALVAGLSAANPAIVPALVGPSVDPLKHYMTEYVGGSPEEAVSIASLQGPAWRKLGVLAGS